MGLADGCHKIGRSRDPQQRLDTVGVLFPSKLAIVHSIASDDTRWLEQVMHAAYNRVRRSGEWFRLSDGDVAVIRSCVKASSFADLPHALLAQYAAYAVLPTRSRKPQLVVAPPPPPPPRPRRVPRPPAPTGVEGDELARFRQKLKELREAGGWTQASLAAALDVSVDAVYFWEAGRREPSGRLLAKLCQVLGLEPNALTKAMTDPDPAEDA